MKKLLLGLGSVVAIAAPVAAVVACGSKETSIKNVLKDGITANENTLQQVMDFGDKVQLVDAGQTQSFKVAYEGARERDKNDFEYFFLKEDDLFFRQFQDCRDLLTRQNPGSFCPLNLNL